MDQKLKAFIVVGTISMIIYTIYLMTSNGERSFLEATGNRNAANQKLMVVDQGTGEISFVKKSLEGINQNFTTEDVKIQNALKNLLGDNMNNYGGYTKTGNDGVLAKMAAADQARRTHEDEKYATKTYVNGELAKKQATGNYIVRDSWYNIIAKPHGETVLRWANYNDNKGKLTVNLVGKKGSVGHREDAKWKIS